MKNDQSSTGIKDTITVTLRIDFIIIAEFLYLLMKMISFYFYLVLFKNV